MARNNRRRRKSRLPKALSRAGKPVLVLLVVAAIGASYAWHEGRNWRPDEALWPDQGALIGAGDGAVDFDTIAGLGAKFVYLEASDGATTSHGLARRPAHRRSRSAPPQPRKTIDPRHWCSSMARALRPCFLPPSRVDDETQKLVYGMLIC